MNWTKPKSEFRKAPVVLQVLPEMRSGGVERGTIEMAGAIAKAGWKSIVASAGGPLVKKLAYAGAEHITLPLETKNPFKIMSNISALAKVIQENRVDIVHARSRAPAWSAYYATKRTKRVFLTTFHGIYGLQNEWKRKYNGIMTRGERVIAISEFCADHVRTNYQVPDEKIRIIPRGVDLDIFDPTKVNRQRVVELAKQWRLPDDLPVILLPGRLTRWKGQNILIEALKGLTDQRYFCVLVGDHEGHPAYREELEKLILQHHLGGQVRIVGNTQDMAAAYMLAHVVVSPSIEPEAFGRVAIEAQAMGKPVIAFDHGGQKETILHGETGWLIEPGSVSGLRNAVAESLAMDEATLEHIADNAMMHVRGHFSSSLMCEGTLAVYEELLAEHKLI